MKLKQSLLQILTVCGTISLISCGNNSSGKVRIAATFAPIYDYAARIAGDKAEIINIVGENEPHEFSPNSAKTMSFVEKADLLLGYGHGIDSWAEGLNAEAYVNVTKNVEFDIDNGADPHAWLSINKAKQMLNNVAEALIEKDPSNKDSYEANLQKALFDYDAVDKQYENKLAGKLENPYFVTSHEAFAYLAKDYDLVQVGINDVAGHEASSSRITQIVDFIQDNQIKCIFLEELDAAGNVETIKTELANRGYTIEYDVLSAYECATEKSWNEGDDFLSVMKENLEVMEKWMA